MRIHNFWANSATQRLERLAADMAESCLPWILSQVKPRISAVEQACRRGYVRAWAGLALEGRGMTERLQGLSPEERGMVVARAMESMVTEVLRKIPSRHRQSARRAA